MKNENYFKLFDKEIEMQVENYLQFCTIFYYHSNLNGYERGRNLSRQKILRVFNLTKKKKKRLNRYLFVYDVNTYTHSYFMGK